MYRISGQSDWADARHQIKRTVVVGTDLNNTVSPSAVITQINSDGFRVNIGGLRNIELKWSLLEYCWKEFCDEGVYDQTVFDNPFGKAFLDSDSLDFLVRRFLRISGLLSINNKEQMNLPL